MNPKKKTSCFLNLSQYHYSTVNTVINCHVPAFAIFLKPYHAISKCGQCCNAFQKPPAPIADPLCNACALAPALSARLRRSRLVLSANAGQCFCDSSAAMPAALAAISAVGLDTPEPCGKPSLLAAPKPPLSSSARSCRKISISRHNDK